MSHSSFLTRSLYAISVLAFPRDIQLTVVDQPITYTEHHIASAKTFIQTASIHNPVKETIYFVSFFLRFQLSINFFTLLTFTFLLRYFCYSLASKESLWLFSKRIRR